LETAAHLKCVEHNSLGGSTPLCSAIKNQFVLVEVCGEGSVIGKHIK
jgi:hypothetical protein